MNTLSIRNCIFIRRNCTYIICINFVIKYTYFVSTSKLYSLNVTRLQAGSEALNIMIDYHKLNISAVLIKIFLHVKYQFIPNRGCSSLLQLIYLFAIFRTFQDVVDNYQWHNSLQSFGCVMIFSIWYLIFMYLEALNPKRTFTFIHHVSIFRNSKFLLF